MKTVIIFVGLIVVVSSCTLHKPIKGEPLDDVDDDSLPLTASAVNNPKRVSRVASEPNSIETIQESQSNSNDEVSELSQVPVNRKSPSPRAAPEGPFAAFPPSAPFDPRLSLAPIPPAASFDPRLTYGATPPFAPAAPRTPFADIPSYAPAAPRTPFASIPSYAAPKRPLASVPSATPNAPKTSFAAIPPTAPFAPKVSFPAIPPAAPVAPFAPKYNVQERREPQWAILRSNMDNNFDGNFKYDFETENGIVVNAEGTLRQLGPEEIGQAIQGSYSYTSPDGTPIVTSYIADENGFQVQGDHLPVAPAEPELPPLIAKSVAYILSHPPLPENQQ